MTVGHQKGDTVGYLKRAGDLSSLFTAGAASMYLVRQFMQYKFKEDVVGITEKIKYFFSYEMRKNYDFYLVLIILLLLFFAVSTIFHKLPQIPLAISVLPLVQAVMMADLERIYERPMFYIVMTMILPIGCICECIRRDKEDSGRRSAIGTDLLALVVCGFCALVLYTTRDVSLIEKEKVSAFELIIYNAFQYYSPLMWAFKYGVIAFPVLVVIRLLHRDLYYIDGILSIVPLVSAFIYWGSEEKTIFAPVLVCLCAIYAAARISTMLCCKARIKPPKNKIKKEANT